MCRSCGCDDPKMLRADAEQREQLELADFPADAQLRDHRPLPGRKNTRTWCKGKVGREHVVEIVIPENSSYNWNRTFSCGKTDRESWLAVDGWRCMHVERCFACGKVLTPEFKMGPDKCPDYSREVT